MLPICTTVLGLLLFLSAGVAFAAPPLYFGAALTQYYAVTRGNGPNPYSKESVSEVSPVLNLRDRSRNYNASLVYAPSLGYNSIGQGQYLRNRYQSHLDVHTRQNKMGVAAFASEARESRSTNSLTDTSIESSTGEDAGGVNVRRWSLLPRMHYSLPGTINLRLNGGLEGAEPVGQAGNKSESQSMAVLVDSGQLFQKNRLSANWRSRDIVRFGAGRSRVEKSLVKFSHYITPRFTVGLGYGEDRIDQNSQRRFLFRKLEEIHHVFHKIL